MLHSEALFKKERNFYYFGKLVMKAVNNLRRIKTNKMNTQRLHLYKNIYVAVHICVCHVIDPIVTVLVYAC